MTDTRFRNLDDLARLPYFTVRDGRIALADPSIGPAIDVHTHLAMAFVRPLSVDLLSETPETEHYLPASRPLDLDVYANRNFTPQDLTRLERDLSLMSLTARGQRRTHTAPNLAREMASLGIARSCILPIDWPVLSDNAGSHLAAAAARSELVGFGSVHPFRRDLDRELDRQVALGARGIKLHPTVQIVPPDHPRLERVYRGCAARKLPILWHCGPVGIEPAYAKRLSDVSHFDRPVEQHHDVTFILGHSGALQWPMAVELARRYPNVYLELSSQGVSAIRTILERVDSRRLLFGSDWPFYHQALPLAKVLLATEGAPALRRAVLYDNAARLLGLPGRPAAEA